MPKYRYVGNKNFQTDYTTSIVLENDDSGEPSRVLGLGGVEELSDAQYESLKENYDLVKVQDESSHPAPTPVRKP